MTINRNPRATRAKKSQLTALEAGKKVTKVVLGVALSISLLSGAKELVTLRPNNYEAHEPISIEEVAGEHIYYNGSNHYHVDYSNLETTEGIKIPDGANVVWLSNNLLTSVDGIENPEEIEILTIENNSVDKIDLEKFPNLKELYIWGNYELYTEDVVKYCEEHNIRLDITRRDVYYVNEVKKILPTLNLEGLSDLEKERIIFKYVIENMHYDEVEIDYGLKGALIGMGGPSSYSALFGAMCDLAGIDTFKASSLTRDSKQEWVIVEIDGQYMLCDPMNSDLNLGQLAYSVDEYTGNNYDPYFNQTNEGFISSRYNNSAINRKSEFVNDGRMQQVFASKPVERRESIINNQIVAMLTGDNSKIKKEVQSVSTLKDNYETNVKLLEIVIQGIIGGSIILLSGLALKLLKDEIKAGRINVKKLHLKKENKAQEPAPGAELSEQDLQWLGAMVYNYCRDMNSIEKYPQLFEYYKSTLHMTREQRAAKSLLKSGIAIDCDEIDPRFRKSLIDKQIIAEQYISDVLEKALARKQNMNIGYPPIR